MNKMARLQQYVLLLVKVVSLVNGNTNGTNETIFITGFDEENFLQKSCEGLCGQYLLLPCSCDEYCQVFKRCCFDYNTTCEAEAVQSRQKHKHLEDLETTCIQTSASFMEQVISSCPPNTKTHLVQECEADRKSPFIPHVTSTKTRLSYKNIYCMLCNGEHDSDAEFWSSILGTFNRRQIPKTSADEVEKFLHISNTVVSPVTALKIPCYPRLITTCSANKSTSTQVRNLCEESHISMVTNIGKTFQIFKNIHCLKCNNLEILNYRNTGQDDLKMGARFPPFHLTMVWKGSNNIVISFPDIAYFSLLDQVQCSVDDNGAVQGCNVRKCFGTIEVDDNACQLTGSYFGCLSYVFRITVILPENRLSLPSDKIINDIGLTLEQITEDIEALHNMSNHLSSNLSVSNVKTSNNGVSWDKFLDKLVYQMCETNFRSIYHSSFVKIVNQSYQLSKLGFNGYLCLCQSNVKCYQTCVPTEQYRCLPNCQMAVSYEPSPILSSGEKCICFRWVVLLISSGIIWLSIVTDRLDVVDRSDDII